MPVLLMLLCRSLCTLHRLPSSTSTLMPCLPSLHSCAPASTWLSHPACVVQSTGKYFRSFANNFRFPDLVSDGVAYMSGVQADSRTGCPAAFNSTDATFGEAFRGYLPEDADDDVVKKAESLAATQGEFEIDEAAAVAADGEDAVEEFMEKCPGTLSDADVSVCFSLSFCTLLEFVGGSHAPCAWLFLILANDVCGWRTGLSR